MKHPPEENEAEEKENIPRFLLQLLTGKCLNKVSNERRVGPVQSTVSRRIQLGYLVVEDSASGRAEIGSKCLGNSIAQVWYLLVIGLPPIPFS